MVLDYLDSRMFEPVYNNELPMLDLVSVTGAAKIIQRAIVYKQDIFVYGDYDTDGLCSQLVWKEVFGKLGYKNVRHFKYSKRTHALDCDVLRQIKGSGNELVIVCDTGSSREDGDVISLLAMKGCSVLVIDHHKYEGDYSGSSTGRVWMFNSYEERRDLGMSEVCGAYSALLVAKVLCEDLMCDVLPFNARVYALLAMYADGMDMSSTLARALYNNVANFKSEGPLLVDILNEWGYKYTRRFFSFIIAPKINACFRMEKFGILNHVISAEDRFDMKGTVGQMMKVHDEASKLTEPFADMFAVEGYGTIELCICEPTLELRAMNVVNFTGLVAMHIAHRDKCAVFAVVHEDCLYHGSYRDFLNRPLLEECSVFMDSIGGHPSAFGFEFRSLAKIRRYIRLLGQRVPKVGVTESFTMASSLVCDDTDVNTLALYNEYMTVKPQVLVTHRCVDAFCRRKTKFTKIYDVGLPVCVRSKSSLRSGQQIVLESCITNKVELRVVD